jgi:hypothetical protein
MNRTTASHALPVAERTPARQARAPWIASLLSASLLLASCGGADEQVGLEAASAFSAAGAASAPEPEPKPTCDRSPTAQRGCVVP